MKNKINSPAAALTSIGDGRYCNREGSCEEAAGARGGVAAVLGNSCTLQSLAGCQAKNSSAAAASGAAE